ncbi:hypothetical protein [Peterkaempfera sp. SMS 1(5)a]|uniref:hypothetical protein n=1 Tax=Peterkaempfera podocarpi TaxID=3232308 RepID=UPI003672101E
MTARSDLLALTPDTLAALANRGLVKRAAKELDAGAGPSVTTGPDGTVHGHFPDGTRAALPPGLGLDAAECSCAAPGICRHRIGLVLAYQADHTGGTAGPAPAPADATTGPATTDTTDTTGSVTTTVSGAPAVGWSPGTVDDDTLTRRLGNRAVTAARRILERGCTAVLHRPTAEEPTPRVELPTCTVRFPVPHEIGHAVTDVAPELRGQMIALAVWAFRAGDEQGATQVDMGGRADTKGEGGSASLRRAVALADELLIEGIAQAGPVFGGTLRRAADELTAQSLHWPAGAVDELAAQLDAYTARSTLHQPERFALLLTELHARSRAAAHPSVLGSGEAHETPLRRVRLVALGCRISGTSRDRTAHIYFAHPGAGTALVLRRSWQLTDDDQQLTGHDLGGRRLLGSPLRALSAANVVSEHTSRTAGRAVTISRGRIAATSVTPVGSAWAELPEPLLLRDLAAHLRRWDGRPPRLIRPRIEAESVHVIAVSAVDSVGYDPAEQRLEAAVRDEAGNAAVVRADHNPFCPGGLDALAAALECDGPRPLLISGMLSRAGGRTVIDPLAVLTADGPVIPDLAPGDGSAALAAAVPRPPHPVTAALEGALAALADTAHRGLRHQTAATRVRLADAAAELHRIGLHTAAALLRTFTDTLHLKGAQAAAGAWVDAHLRLAVTLELHQEQAPGAHRP